MHLEAFLSNSPREFFEGVRLNIYPHPKKNDWPLGIQVATMYDERQISEGWDFVIFYHEEDAFYKIKRAVGSKWDEIGQQRIGKENGFFVALYVDRKQCSYNKAITFLEKQVKWTERSKSGRFIIWNESLPEPKVPSVRLRKKNHREDKQLRENIRYSEGLNDKSWPIEKSNFRRAIALFHWDFMNSPGKENRKIRPLLINTLYMLRDTNIFALNHYHSRYKKQLLKGEIPPENEPGTKPEVNEMVINEMRDDFYLTEFCVEHADFLYPADLDK